MNDTTTTHDAESPPASEGSTTSWPATEVDLPDDVPTPRATSNADKEVIDSSITPETTPEQLANANGPSSSTTDSLATPASPSWSRSRLPVSDDEDGASKAEELMKEKEDVKGEDGSKKEELGSLGSLGENKAEPHVKEDAKADEDAASKEGTEDHPKRPAVFLTRPTMSGENEMVSITQSSTPAGSVANDKDEDKTDPRSIRITTFLPETKTFFTSPTTTNAVPNSGVSPLTQTFFSTDFSVRSPPRPGGAFITELPSDAEVTVSQAVKVTVGEPKPPRPRSRDPSRSRNASPARRPPFQNRNRLPSPSPVRPPRPQSVSYARPYRPLSDSDDDTSDARPTHLPFVRGRTVVSAPPTRTAAPASFKNHRHPPLSSHVPPVMPSWHDEPRRSASRPDEPGRRSPRYGERSVHSLVTLLDDLKKALKTDPATYYAVKGVLAEHELRKKEESYKARDEKRSPAPRHEARPTLHEERRTRHEERPADVFERRIPVSLAFMTGASGSETEVEKGGPLPQDKLRKPAHRSVPPSRSAQPTHSNERYKNSEKLPKSPRGVKHAEDDRRPHRPIPVRIHHPLSHAIPSPEPYPSSRDPSPQRFLPHSQTLTMAQAARLAEGLGDRRQAEDLRKTGLKSGDKVSLLDERSSGEKLKRKGEKIPSGTTKSLKKDKKDGDRRDDRPRTARRHSFDSVFDYKPSLNSSRADTKTHGEPFSSRKAEKSSRSRKDDPYFSPVDKPSDHRYSTGRPRETVDRYVASEASSMKAGKGKERAISFDFDDLM
ncbi:proteophosphoglycan ppg4 [Rhodotorula toruloides]|uniref:Proteophosphoglycan ppg4 n=1 Tax=Rhodotorula toruloides TaxID=5286 RepID=A0A511KNM0_RHOTO|nr:proteophosphoglycan ppg4 [Rhodotorula toruloides]